MTKVSILLIFVLVFVPLLALAQESDGCSRVRITKEYNRESYSEYNTNDKCVLDKYMFNDFNADIEFSISKMDIKGYGFRILKDEQCNGYVLERKTTVNYRDDISTIRKSHPSATLETCDKGKGYNLSTAVETVRWPISDSLHNKLHSTLHDLIDNYKIKGGMVLVMDGYSCTFRIVVGDELWALYAHCPTGIIYDIYLIGCQLFDDAAKGPIDEEKYFKMLDKLGL